MAQEDPSRPVWPSCPAAGWKSGVDMLTGLPNGNTLVTRPTSKLATHPTSAGTSVHGEVRVWTELCGDVNCTFVSGLDYDQGFIGKTPAAANAQDCCNLCAADPADCYAASFYEGTCYFKPSGKPFSWGTGVVSVFPPGATPPPQPARTVETHGYYQHGGGFPAVNGDNALSPFNVYLPLSLAASGPRGVGYYGVYASEFGASAWSSFESIAPTLAPNHWALMGGVAPDTCDDKGWPSVCTGDNPLAQRNYPCNNYILSYYGAAQVAKLNTTGADPFKKQLYLCTLASALFMRSDIENRRSDNQFGTVEWQLGENWWVHANTQKQQHTTHTRARARRERGTF
jgi:beta-mannosidase